jgi:DNA-binding MarR family transcriptional regulator
MTKYELLATLADMEELDATAAESLAMSSAGLGMALLRLCRQGLLAREFDDAGRYCYRLTERGLDRLQYLESHT